MRLRYLIAGLAAVGLIVLFKPSHKAPATAPCSFGASPCIELLSAEGKVVAKFNDFRFGAKGCVYYRANINVTSWQHYCGGRLQWIGPSPASKS